MIYCAGLSADFRVRPFDTIEAHTTDVAELLKNADFDSFLLLSSTRVYAGAESTDEESTLRVAPQLPDHLYNISKIAGEAICLSNARPTIRVVRMSNVIGDDFTSGMQMSEVLHAAVRGSVTFTASWNSAKDYIWVDDVARMLIEIARRGKERLYNLATGVNVTNRELGDILASLTGCSVGVAPGSPSIIFGNIALRRRRRPGTA